MVRTGAGEDERGDGGGVNAHPEGMGQTAAVAGSGESGSVAPSVAVPAGVGRTLAEDILAFGTANAPDPADVHAGPTGEPGEEIGGASIGQVSSADVVAGLVVGRGEADSAGAEGAAATERVALPAGIDQHAVEVGSDTATLAVPPQEGSGTAGSGLPLKPRRISKPMLAAAAIAGVVLIAIPFALDSLGRHDSPRGAGADAAAFSGGGGPSSGFVPSAETGIPQYAGDSGASQAVGAPAVGQPAVVPTQAARPAAVTGAAQSAAVTGAPQPTSPPASRPPVAPPAPPASPHPAPPTSSTTSGNVQVSGQVSCTSGNSIEGVWVAATQGSGWAQWKGLGNGSTADYWYTLPISEPYSLHVGCGGTTASWAVAAESPQVSGTHNSFNCIDVSGQPGYKTCVAR